MRPRLSARFLFALIGAVSCLLAALALEGIFTKARTSRWVDDHDTPVLLFFSHSSSETERRLHEAEAHSGDVEVILTWNNMNDLDLHCVDPSGEEICFHHKLSEKTGGALDVDMNSGQRVSPTELYTNHPVEHIYWPHGRAPVGRYLVYVDHYSRHGGMDPTAYQVTVKEFGRTHVYNGVISYGYGRTARVPGKFISEFTTGRRAFEFVGLPAGFWRALLIIGVWSAAITGALASGLLGGLYLFYRRVYRKRFLPIGKTARIAGFGAVWGALAGCLGQGVYAFLPARFLQLHPSVSHAIGLALLASIVGIALGGIPHFKRGWAFLAGLLGGAASGWVFFKLYDVLGYSNRSEMIGRIAAAVVIGAFIGFTVALIVEPPPPPEEPIEYEDEALDGMQPLSLRANRIGPTGKLRRSGGVGVRG
jgi:hypothetical protein